MSESEFISNWLVLGPISNTSYQSTPHFPTDGHPLAKDIIQDIDTSELLPETITSSPGAAPQEGDAVSYRSDIFAKGSYKWRSLEFANMHWNDVADVRDNIHQKLPQEFKDKHHVLAFFLVFIQSPELRNTRLNVRSDDSLRAWLNGYELESLAFEGERYIDASENHADITLHKGWNVLLAAVAETHVEWGFSARITDGENLKFATEKPIQDTALAPGKRIKLNLEEISNSHAVFEKDQVLTHDQLNGITDYLDDQNRLTRLNMLGVGIICGLRASLKNGIVTVTKGVGVTTDSDLLNFPGKLDFNGFRVYDKSKPAYSLFFENGDVTQEMIPVYELIDSKTQQDSSVKPLSQFEALTTKSLGNMVVVLLMESSVTDRDICSATDCDNLGQVYQDIVRLLLVEKSEITPLLGAMHVSHDAFIKLNPVIAKRALFGTSTWTNTLQLPQLSDRGALSKKANWTDATQLAEVYQTACSSITKQLLTELKNLKKLYPDSFGFLAEIFPSAPFPDWSAKLEELGVKRIEQIKTATDIQYYYDFLKDLVETYNQFLELTFNDRTVCCPDKNAFPKHLLLGNLLPQGNPDENRTPFYPSPLASKTADQLCHAKFLAQKIGAMINSFQLQEAKDIRITPSMAEDISLEERAIPYYFLVDPTTRIHANWSYRLHQRGMDAYNYGYYADAYGAKGGAASPLTYQIGRFSFFRVEGQLGKNIKVAVEQIEKSIHEYNLPFAVHAVKLGDATVNIYKKSGANYSDLHRLHYLIRQELYHQLEQVIRFCRYVLIPQNVGVVNRETESKNPFGIIVTNAEQACKRLRYNYSKYKADTSRGWMQNMTLVLQKIADIKSIADKELGKIEQFDALSNNSHILWLYWIEAIIAMKDRREDNKLLFSDFISRHPAMEHFAGVVRGGTLVLVYDDEQRVVADFMLPYFLPDITEVEPDEPVLKDPRTKITRDSESLADLIVAAPVAAATVVEAPAAAPTAEAPAPAARVAIEAKVSSDVLPAQADVQQGPN